MKTNFIPRKNFLTVLIIVFSAVQTVNAQINLKLTLFLEGFYRPSLDPNIVPNPFPMDNYGAGGCLYLCGMIDGFPANFEDVDYITISLIDPVILQNTGNIEVATFETNTGILKIDGSLEIPFSAGANSHSYYLKIEHRNHLRTWSAEPVPMISPVTEYSFADFGQAYEFPGNAFHATTEVEPDRWAIYAGDINRDDFIDIVDIPTLTMQIEYPVNYPTEPYPFGYKVGDLDGDAFIDIVDIPWLTTNIVRGIYSQHP